MHVLVDAYNVLHVVGVLPPEHAGIDLEELADLIAASRYGGHPVLLVCDADPEAASSRHLRGQGPSRGRSGTDSQTTGSST